MKRYFPTYLYGALIILAGTLLLFSQNNSFTIVRIALGITLIFGAISSFLTALSRPGKQVQFAYHEMHALAMLVYGISVLFFCSELATLADFTTFLFLFYAFSEIIFSNWLLNLKKRVILKVIVVRIVLGLVVGAGTVIIRHYFSTNTTLALAGYGLLFIIVGTNILLYVPIMKVNE